MVQSKIKTSTKLLEELDKLLSKAGDDFGPIILEELKIRKQLRLKTNKILTTN